MPELTAAAFIGALIANQSDEELRKIQRYFKSGEGDYGEGNRFIGVRMGTVFALAKQSIDLPPPELEVLLDSDMHEARAGALSIMAKQAARKKTPLERREALYELYLRRHDRINNWDLVDLAARDVVGLWLLDRPRDVLYELATSSNMWERRTAITATAAFLMKRKEVDDTFAIAELLLNDHEDLIHKATGGWLRVAGDIDRPRLNAFLDAYAATMPRVMLRYAIEHFDAAERQHYMGLKKR
ncbi:MAG: DNA alkylation repair protein [Dehalococcoidia bacterium]